MKYRSWYEILLTLSETTAVTLTFCHLCTVNVGNFRVFQAFVFFPKITHAKIKPICLYEGNRSSIVKITPTRNKCLANIFVKFQTTLFKPNSRSGSIFCSLCIAVQCTGTNDVCMVYTNVNVEVFCPVQYLSQSGMNTLLVPVAIDIFITGPNRLSDWKIYI